MALTITPAPCRLLLRAKKACASRQRHGLALPGITRHAALLRQRAGARLVAEQRELLGAWGR